MKKIIFLFLLLCCLSCTGPRIVEVPVETVKTEYRDKFIKDSIYIKDSVDIAIYNDTVYKTKYRYRYRDKLITDTVIKCDTVTVVKEVTVYKEVNKLKQWQKTMIAAGMFSILIILWRISRKFRF